MTAELVTWSVAIAAFVLALIAVTVVLRWVGIDDDWDPSR